MERHGSAAPTAVWPKPPQLVPGSGWCPAAPHPGGEPVGGLGRRAGRQQCGDQEGLSSEGAAPGTS